MADPLIIALTKDVWTKVATNVTSGQVHITRSAPSIYEQTYRDTGGSAPTNEVDAIKFDPSGTEVISSSLGIDVYIKAKGVAGAVRVDL